MPALRNFDDFLGLGCYSGSITLLIYPVKSPTQQDALCVAYRWFVAKKAGCA